MSSSEEPKPRFEVRMTSDSHFGWIRTRMALERTLMAWVRTSVALIGFGFTIVQFFQRINEMQGVAPAARPQAPRQMGLMLIGAGILALLVSAVQYRRIVAYLWEPPFTPLAGMEEGKGMSSALTATPLLAVVIAILLIGIFAFGAVLLRFV
jgi:putative membrane protein